jgi:hypothetical protein
MNYVNYIQKTPSSTYSSIINKEHMDRAKTIKLASGGVNLFYTEAPASSASWWDRMFGDA